MQPLHKKRNRIIGIGLIIFMSLVVLRVTPIAESVRSVLGSFVNPVVAKGSAIGVFVQSTFSFVGDIGSVREEQQRLYQENISLRATKAEMEVLRTENERLRQSLSLLPREDFSLIGADIIARDPLGGGQWVMINRGSVEGIALQQSVIFDERILIGRVSEVFEHQSRVQLITHSDSVIPVMHSETQTEALAQGDHGIGITIADIPRDIELAEGDVFVTIGLEGTKVIDRLSVGTIQHIEESSDYLVQNAYLVPLVDTRDIHEVYIITQ